MIILGRIIVVRIPRHMLTRGWQFERHSHIMIDLKKIRQLGNRKWRIPRRPLRPLTHILGQHQGSVLSVSNQVTDLSTIPIEGQYTWLRGMKNMRTKSVVSQMDMEMRKRTMMKMMMGVTMW